MVNNSTFKLNASYVLDTVGIRNQLATLEYVRWCMFGGFHSDINMDP